jgi:AcrR family transcriptional regulator
MAGRSQNGGERSTSRASARRAREQEIVEATRALFDERGVQDAPVEEIARAVGINKALIYRHFGSQEELFVLTVTSYLAELESSFAAVDEGLEPVTQLREVSERYGAFCREYPAFLDCALSLMRRPYSELADRVSAGVLFRLGQAMSGCLSRLSRILAEGAEKGVFRVDDPDYIANYLYAQGLGAMHLARVGAGVRVLAPGVPQMFPIDPEDVVRTAVEGTFAYILAPETNGNSSKSHNGKSKAKSADAKPSTAKPRATKSRSS